MLKLDEPEIKPAMPAKFALPAPPKPEFLHIQKQTVQRSQTIDFGFLKEIITKESVPDFSGYNTMLRRNSGNTLKPKTNILYRPLINKIPSDPSTILTAMFDIEAVSKKAGQEISVFTCDVISNCTGLSTTSSGATKRDGTNSYELEACIG